MKNQFEDVMSKHTDENLQKIVSSEAGDYQPEAVKAAEQEVKKRELVRDTLSKSPDKQILEILELRKNYSRQEIEAAEIEAKKRNLNFSYTEEKLGVSVKKEIKEHKTDVVNERYPVLKFISRVYKVLAWVILVATVIIFLYILSQNGHVEIPFAIGTLFIGGFLFVILLSVAGAIKVFIDIEHNTRITAMNSKK